MTNTTEMRALSAEEIDAVAGGSSTNTIAVTQNNNANATATSSSSTAPGYTKHPWGHSAYPLW